MKKCIPLLILALLMMPAARAQAPKNTHTDSIQKATSTSSVDPTTYVVGAGDLLQITVWKESELSGSMTVRPDGMISLVLIGDTQAAGLTPMQLGAAIAQKLRKYIQDPNVYVVVTAANSHRVFLIGEVQHVGAVMLTANMTPLEAIAMAGGVTPFANTKHIYILRGQTGKQIKIPFNYKKTLKGISRQNITLVPGDTIVVP